MTQKYIFLQKFHENDFVHDMNVTINIVGNA